MRRPVFIILQIVFLLFATASALAVFEVWGARVVTPVAGAMLVVCVVIAFPLQVWFFGTRVSRAKTVRKRIEHGECPQCGYNLRGTPGRCPECGMVQTLATLEQLLKERTT